MFKTVAENLKESNIQTWACVEDNILEYDDFNYVYTSSEICYYEDMKYIGRGWLCGYTEEGVLWFNNDNLIDFYLNIIDKKDNLST